VAEWKTARHLTDHYRAHRSEFPGSSIEDYDASARETLLIGVSFTYVDFRTDEDRVGYFDRQTGRFTATTIDDSIVTHFFTDEDHITRLLYNDYEPE
jgi:hypothetical protein